MAALCAAIAGVILLVGGGRHTTSPSALPSWPQSDLLVRTPHSGKTRTASITVRFRSGLSSAKQKQLLSGYGTVATGSLPLGLSVLSVAPSKAKRLLAHLRASHDVASATPNEVRSIAGGATNSAISRQWALQRIGWQSAYRNATAKRNVKVAILDTGVDGTLDDLHSHLVGGYSAFAGSTATSDPNGHGTWMTSTALAVDPYAKVMPVQVLDAHGLGTDSDIIKGLVWAANHHANVILMSFAGSGYSPDLQRAIDYAWSKGAVVVAATGNRGSSTPTYPAGDAHVVGVSATDPLDRLWSGSNYGADTFIAAPGVNIVADAPGGGTTTVTGTSASAALVAGGAALLLGNDKKATNANVIGKLAASAHKAGTRAQTGNGRLDLARALTLHTTKAIVPAGVSGRQNGGPFTGPYEAAASATDLTVVGSGDCRPPSSTTLVITLTAAVPVGSTLFVSPARTPTAEPLSPPPTTSGRPTPDSHDVQPEQLVPPHDALDPSVDRHHGSRGRQHRHHRLPDGTRAKAATLFYFNGVLSATPLDKSVTATGATDTRDGDDVRCDDPGVRAGHRRIANATPGAANRLLRPAPRRRHRRPRCRWSPSSRRVGDRRPDLRLGHRDQRVDGHRPTYKVDHDGPDAVGQRRARHEHQRPVLELGEQHPLLQPELAGRHVHDQRLAGRHGGSGLVGDAFPGLNGTSSEVLADNPVSYWRLGETSGTTATDAKGVQNGTYTGGYTLGVAGALPGDPNKAVTLNGTTGYVNVGNPAGLQLTSGTEEAWFKTSDNTAAYHNILQKQNAYAIMINTGILGEYDPGSNSFLSTGINVADGQWHLVDIVFQSGVANGTKFYLDGKLVLTTTYTQANQTGNLQIGANGAGTEFWNGSIDDVAIYGAQLTQARILTHYYGAATVPPAPTGFTAAGTTATAATWQSLTHTFATTNTTAPSSEIVTALDAAGNTASTTVNFIRDVLAPSGGISVTLGTNPSVQYYNSGTSTYYYNPSTLGGDFTITGPGTDAGSGIAQDVFPGINGTSSQILAQSPVLYWRFSETSGTAVADSATGNLNGGTVTTTGTGTVTRNAASALPGDPNPAITFTPSTGTSYVIKASPSNIPSGTANRTIEAWFKTTTTTEQAIASYGCSTCANGQNFGFDVMTSNSLQFWGFGSADLTFTTPYTITDGTWHQGVIEYNGTAISMYLDGIYLGSKTDAINTTAAGTQGFNVGVNNPVSDATNGGKYFNGSIDEVAVYPSVLTAAQVETHYLARTSLATTGFTGAVAVDTTPSYTSATHSFTTANTTAPPPETIGAMDNVDNFGQNTLTFVRDVTPPTGGAFSANGTAATGGGSSSYLTSGTTLTINSRTDYTDSASGLASSTLTIQSATLTGNACGSYGGTTTITGTTSQTVASGNCYLLTLTGTDNVSNVATISTVVKVDTTAPSAPTTFGFSALTNAYYPGAGSTIYLKGGAAGGFTATASGAADADTGIASYTYGAIAGTGWANTLGAYTFTAASPSGSASVTATNGAGVAGSAATFTATVDSTAPSGGAFTANSVAATSGGSSSYLNSGTTLTINSRTDFTDGGSGIATSTLTMATGTLSGNACSAYGAPATIVGTTAQTVASGHCYLLTLTGTDNVGNVAPTISTTVKVDTTAPSAPTGFTFSGLTSSYYPGSGTVIYTKAGAAGGFTATASGSADADTGISGYNYGAIAGTGWANVAGAFTFTGASPTGTSSVTASNNAGLASSATTFTAQSDGTAPAGGALTANTVAASGAGTTSYINSGTTLTINSRTDYTDGGSGLASSTLTMATGTLSGNSCSAYGAPATIVGTTSQTVATAHCYLLTLTGTDNVGNAASISTTVMVDTTAPSAPTGFTFSGLTNAYYPGAGSTVYFKGGAIGGFTATASGATDADSGISTYNYGAIAGTGWANAAGAYTFTAASPSGTGAVTATNNAGLTGSSASFTATVDSTAPATGAFTANSVAATGGGSSSNITAGTTLTINSRTDYTDGGSGLRVLDADDGDRERSRATPVARTARPRRSPAPRRRRSPADTATC